MTILFRWKRATSTTFPFLHSAKKGKLKILIFASQFLATLPPSVAQGGSIKSMAAYISMMGSGMEGMSNNSLMMPPGNDIMDEAATDQGVKIVVKSTSAEEEFYRQHSRVWKFRSENLDDDEFEVAAAGSGWIVEEEDCDNFQRYLTVFNIGPITCTAQQLNKQKITMLWNVFQCY